MSDHNMELKEWPLKSSEELLRTPVFNVLRERAVSPRNGGEGTFYLLECGDWVNVIALTSRKEFVMIRQFRHGNRSFEWEIPGGYIDGTDAGPVEAGLRELAEETGFSGVEASVIGRMCPNPAIQRNTCYTVLVRNCERTAGQRLDPGEDIEPVLVPAGQVDRMIREGKINHGVILAALFYYYLESQF